MGPELTPQRKARIARMILGIPEPVEPTVEELLDQLAADKRKEPPYPFCSHAEKCIAAGRCERTVKGEPWSCAD